MFVSSLHLSMSNGHASLNVHFGSFSDRHLLHPFFGGGLQSCMKTLFKVDFALKIQSARKDNQETSKPKVKGGIGNLVHVCEFCPLPGE